MTVSLYEDNIKIHIGSWDNNNLIVKLASQLKIKAESLWSEDSKHRLCFYDIKLNENSADTQFIIKQLKWELEQIPNLILIYEEKQ